MKESFQLKKDEDVKGFCQEVFRKVAQTLINYKSHIDNYSGSGDIARKIDPWINLPIITHINNALGFSGGFGVPGGVGVGGKYDNVESRQINTSNAFSEQGFEQIVKDWLNEIFGVQGTGGVVCVIDNLELLETGVAARRTLEALRDRLFNVNGLRWVFCGANGVIHSLAASPRLSSYISTPIIDVAHISPQYINPLIMARLDEFRLDSSSNENGLPIRLCDLDRLYIAVNFNLRDMLGLADDYCEHMHAIGRADLTDSQKESRFEKWLHRESTSKYLALQSRLPSDAWIILDIAMSPECNGTFGVGDYDAFNSSSRKTISKTTFDRWLRDYIKLGLISKSIDDDSTDDGSKRDDGFRRDVFTVTAKGSLVHYARLISGDAKSGSPDPAAWLRRVHAK